MYCPKCGTECLRDEVDNGVAILEGPYGCPNCMWSEWPEYDGGNRQTPKGGILDQ